MCHARPVGIPKELIAHVPARFERSDLGMLGGSPRTQWRNSCYQGRLGRKSHQAVTDPALIQESIKLILKIESTAQEISFRQRSRVGEKRWQLRRHARQGNRSQGALNRSAKRLQDGKAPAPLCKLRDVTK